MNFVIFWVATWSTWGLVYWLGRAHERNAVEEAMWGWPGTKRRKLIEKLQMMEKELP